MGKKVLLIAFYNHPEYYPPTLNAIDQLAGKYDEILVLHRNIKGFDWVYPLNVKLFGPKELLPAREVEKARLPKKLRWFFAYCSMFIRIFRLYRPGTVLFYDSIPILSYRLIRFFIKAPAILWYHNHDVSEKAYIRKYSISWFAWKSESWIFPRLSIFSLPSLERKICFPMDRLRGEFVFIPNYPSLKRYNSNFVKPRNEIKILFQGSIGPYHGLEEIVPLLGKTYGGLPLKLVLKGFVKEDYLTELLRLSVLHGVQSQIEYLPPTGYQEVFKNASTCHIGIGIFMKQDMMNKTLGSASNKIYEYAAAGLPVLIYNNTHFREYLGNRDWVFFTDGSSASIEFCINEIIKDYQNTSNSARRDFVEEFSFENHFNKVFPLLD